MPGASFLYKGCVIPVANAGNLHLIERLTQLAAECEHQHRANAWMKAVDSISLYPLQIRSVEEASDLKHIGDYIANRIGTFLEAAKKKAEKEARAQAKANKQSNSQSSTQSTYSSQSSQSSQPISFSQSDDSIQFSQPSYSQQVYRSVSLAAAASRSASQSNVPLSDQIPNQPVSRSSSQSNIQSASQSSDQSVSIAPPRTRAYTPKWGSSACFVLLGLALKLNDQSISQSNNHSDNPSTNKQSLESFCKQTFPAITQSKFTAGFKTLNDNAMIIISTSQIDPLTNQSVALTDRSKVIAQTLIKRWETESKQMISQSSNQAAVDTAAPQTLNRSNSSSSQLLSQSSNQSIAQSSSESNIRPVQSVKPPRAPVKSKAAQAIADAESIHRSFLDSIPVHQTHLPFSQFTLHLLIDNRERSGHSQSALSRLLSMQTIKTDVRPLSISDFCWVAHHNESGCEFLIDCLIERKRMSDLIGSIKDGRLAEQRFRLKNTLCDRRIFLIEGPYEQSNSRSFRRPSNGSNQPKYQRSVPESTVESALMGLRMQHGFMVQTTSSLNFSIMFVKQLHKLITDELKKDGVRVRPSTNQSSNQSNQSSNQSNHQAASRCKGAGECFAAFSRRMKKRPADEDDADEEGDDEAENDRSGASSVTQATIATWATQLRMIRRVSPAVAAVVVDMYPSCRDLFEAYEKCESISHEKQLLADIKWGPVRKRRIGNALSERIRDFVRMPQYDAEEEEDDTERVRQALHQRVADPPQPKPKRARTPARAKQARKPVEDNSDDSMPPLSAGSSDDEPGEPIAKRNKQGEPSPAKPRAHRAVPVRVSPRRRQLPSSDSEAELVLSCELASVASKPAKLPSSSHSSSSKQSRPKAVTQSMVDDDDFSMNDDSQSYHDDQFVCDLIDDDDDQFDSFIISDDPEASPLTSNTDQSVSQMPDSSVSEHPMSPSAIHALLFQDDWRLSQAAGRNKPVNRPVSLFADSKRTAVIELSDDSDEEGRSSNQANQVSVKQSNKAQVQSVEQSVQSISTAVDVSLTSIDNQINQSIRSTRQLVERNVGSVAHVINQSIRSTTSVVNQSIRSTTATLHDSVIITTDAVNQSIRSHTQAVNQSIQATTASINQSIKSTTQAITRSLSSHSVDLISSSNNQSNNQSSNQSYIELSDDLLDLSEAERAWILGETRVHHQRSKPHIADDDDVVDLT